MDNHTPDQRRANMRAIRCRDTAIEVKLRRELWSRGIRFRKNCSNVAGKPDIVFKGKKVAVFCDSEFWHGYNWTEQKERIQTNRDYWIPKIERNMQRDSEVNSELESEGFIVLRFWGRDIQKDVSGCADKVADVLKGR
jgi:DNA mismatch endonuclease, patch repair protein